MKKTMYKVKNEKHIFYRLHSDRKKDRYYCLRFTHEGKNHFVGVGWISQGFSIEDAREVKAKIFKELKEKGTFETPAETRQRQKEEKDIENAKNQTFETLYFRQLKENHHRKNTAPEISTVKNNLFPVVGKKGMAEISDIHIVKIEKTMLDKGRALRTLEQNFSVMRQVFNFAEEKEIPFNPKVFRFLKKKLKNVSKKIDNRREAVFTFEEQRILLEYVKKDRPMIYGFCMFGFEAGLRFGEIANLTWNDLNFVNDTIHVRDTKVGKSLTTYMSEPLRNYLLEKKQSENPKPSDLIFLNKNGKKVKQINDTFDRVMKKLGFNDNATSRKDKLVFYSTRHTFGTRQSASGTPLMTVCSLMNHSSSRTTERYVHVQEEQKKDAIKKAVSGLRD